MFGFLRKRKAPTKKTRRKRPVRRRLGPEIRKHYLEHKEAAREMILGRLLYWNQFYSFSIGDVRIKVTTSRWGSCSSNGNLNFHYQLLFLPPEITDYIIVHELCHLGELNHSPAFWSLIEKTIPDYKTHMQALRKYHPLQAHLIKQTQEKT